MGSLDDILRRVQPKAHDHINRETGERLIKELFKELFDATKVVSTQGGVYIDAEQLLAAIEAL